MRLQERRRSHTRDTSSRGFPPRAAERAIEAVHRGARVALWAIAVRGPPVVALRPAGRRTAMISGTTWRWELGCNDIAVRGRAGDARAN
jgi:hypothetical protein